MVAGDHNDTYDALSELPF